MSCIVDFAETASYATNVINGFDIVDMDKSESIISNSSKEETISRGTINDLIEQSSRFDFVDGEAMGEEPSLGIDNEAIVDEIQSELAENSNGQELLSDNNLKAFEFFSNAEFDISNSQFIIKNLGSNGDIKYDDKSGTLSIDGQDLAQLNTSVDLDDDNYEIF